MDLQELKRRWRTRFVVAVVLIGLPLAGYQVNKVLQPQRHALAQTCLGTGDQAQRNVCDYAVVVAACRQGTEPGWRDDVCSYETLEAGQSLTISFPGETGSGRVYTITCKAPFVPSWVARSGNQFNYTQGCRRPPKE